MLAGGDPDLGPSRPGCPDHVGVVGVGDHERHARQSLPPGCGQGGHLVVPRELVAGEVAQDDAARRGGPDRPRQPGLVHLQHEAPVVGRRQRSGETGGRVRAAAVGADGSPVRQRGGEERGRGGLPVRAADQEDPAAAAQRRGGVRGEGGEHPPADDQSRSSAHVAGERGRTSRGVPTEKDASGRPRRIPAGTGRRTPVGSRPRHCLRGVAHASSEGPPACQPPDREARSTGEHEVGVGALGAVRGNRLATPTGTRLGLPGAPGEPGVTNASEEG